MILVLLLAISRKGPLKCLLVGPDPGGLGFWDLLTEAGGPDLQFRWARLGPGLGPDVGPRVVLKWFWDRARTPEPPETARGPTNSPFGAYNNMTVGGVWGLGRG